MTIDSLVYFRSPTNVSIILRIRTRQCLLSSSSSSATIHLATLECVDLLACLSLAYVRGLDRDAMLGGEGGEKGFLFVCCCLTA